MVKRRSSVFPQNNFDAPSARASFVSKNKETPGIFQSLIKTFNGGNTPPGEK